jgi:hypothetical protein
MHCFLSTLCNHLISDIATWTLRQDNLLANVILSLALIGPGFLPDFIGQNCG